MYTHQPHIEKEQVETYQLKKSFRNEHALDTTESYTTKYNNQ